MKKIIVSTPSSLWKIQADSYHIDGQGLNIIKNGGSVGHFPHGQFLSVLVSEGWPKISSTNGEEQITVEPYEN